MVETEVLTWREAGIKEGDEWFECDERQLTIMERFIEEEGGVAWGLLWWGVWGGGCVMVGHGESQLWWWVLKVMRVMMWSMMVM